MSTPRLVLVAKGLLAAERHYAAGAGGRTWWAHLEFTPINIKLTILPKKIEELMNVRGIGEASFLKLKSLVTITPPRTERATNVATVQIRGIMGAASVKRGAFGMQKTTVARLGRNEPCRCSSGRKYKQCCLDKDESKARVAYAKAVAEAPEPSPDAAAAPPRAPKHQTQQPWRAATSRGSHQRVRTPRKVGGS